MSKPDMQYFSEDGTWVKPPGAIRADVVLQGAGGGGGTYGLHMRAHGEDGEITVQSFPADSLPDLVPVEVGKGGRLGGRDGYVLIITHVRR